MIKQIATVTIYVEDQEKALAFWTETLGFTVYRNQPMGPAGNWIEVGAALLFLFWTMLRKAETARPFLFHNTAIYLPLMLEKQHLMNGRKAA
ncbi:hypothetical protein JCM14720_21620 [Calditerricola yamamurae]|nr:hypothetical protein [Bacillota bacterium]